MDIAEIVVGIGSSGALQGAASKAGVDPTQATDMLHGILAHVNDGGQLEGMAESVAGRVGVDPSLVQQFLPQVMGLLQGHSENAAEGVQGMLGSLMGSFGGALSGGQGGSLASEAMNLAGGLFGKRD